MVCRPHDVNNLETCANVEGAVLLGNEENHMSSVPPEAMDYQQPYWFGLDPVGVAMLWSGCGHSSIFSLSRCGRQQITNWSSPTPTR